jgi:hypothetical protein
VVLILSHAVLLTQSIWYWYAFATHSELHFDFALRGMKLQLTSLSHAVEHDAAVAPPPPLVSPPPPPPPGAGWIFVRHAGSQIEFSAQPVKTSICDVVAESQSP